MNFADIINNKTVTVSVAENIVKITHIPTKIVFFQEIGDAGKLVTIHQLRHKLYKEVKLYYSYQKPKG